MTLWIVRFIPYEGGNSVDGFFRSESAAREIWDQVQSTMKICLFRDDFGIEVRVDPKHCAVILTNTSASAAFQAALQTANQSAVNAYGTSFKGSTVQ